MLYDEGARAQWNKISNMIDDREVSKQEMKKEEEKSAPAQ